MLQSAAFDSLIQAGNGMARGLGVLARCLTSRPPSTMGTRFRNPDEGDGEMVALEQFLERAEQLHSMPLPMAFDLATLKVQADDKGNPSPDPLELKPAVLPLSSDARRLWIAYHNETERELAPEGELATVRDVASKSPENACRIAAIFHIWRHGPAAASAPTTWCAASGLHTGSCMRPGES